MQQIINFDIALNYLPYRYRHRSNTRSKRIKVSLQRKSYSRSKMQKSIGVKNIQSSTSPYKRLQNSPFSEEFIGGDDNRMKVGQYFDQGQYDDGFDRLQYSKTQSPLREQQHQELQQTPNSQFSFSKQLQQSQATSNLMKLESQYHKILETSQKQYKPFYLDIKKQSSHNSSPKRDEQEIFNQQDMKEIREALMNKIKQNQFKIVHKQKEQEKVINQSVKQIRQLQPSESLKEGSGQKEQISFDDRYNRLQALNQHSQEHYEKQRKTKIIEIMKKGERSAQNYYNKHNKRIKDGHQQRLNNLNHNSTSIYSNLPNNHIYVGPSSQAKELIHKIPLTNEKSIQKAQQNNKNTLFSQKPNVNSPHKFNDPIKQQSNNYSSLQTSSASQKQQTISSQKPSQNEVYSSYRMMKNSSSKKLEINPLIQDCLPPELLPKSNIKMEDNIFHYKNLQKTATQIAKQKIKVTTSEEPQSFSSILATFSIPPSNNAIKELKQVRSKQKTSFMHKQEVDSPNRPDFNSGYSNKNTLLLIGTCFSNSIYGSPNGYSANMKKKKELMKPAENKNSDTFENCLNFPQATAKANNIYSGQNEQKLCQIIKEDSIQNVGSQEEYEPKYTLTKQGQFMIKLRPQRQNSNFKGQNGMVQVQANGQQIHLSPQTRQQLLQAHLQLCFTPRSNLQSSPLPSNRASQSQFSLPISRVLSNQKGSEQKMEENDRILRMMMRDQDIGQLSSLAEAEDHQTSRQVDSSMTQELCEIINSNEDSNSISSSRNSNLPQQTSEPANQMQEIDGSASNSQLELAHQDNYRANPLVSKHTILNEQILNILNMEDQQQKEYSQNPSRAMQVSLGSQNACSSSLLAYQNHFHPSQAIRKFKHSKHNSADVRNKSINSFANTHSQSAKKRIQVLSESSKRTKSRRQMNATRFKTRLTSN